VDVQIIAHTADSQLVGSPRIRVTIVGPRRWRFIWGDLRLASATGRARRRLERAGRRVLVIGNGGNVPGADVSWVHCVHAAWPVLPADGAPRPRILLARGAKSWARLRERRALERARLVISNSEKTRRDIESHYPGLNTRVARVYLGADPRFVPADAPERQAARLKHGLVGTDPILGFVGALGWDRNKGLDIALEILARLREEPRCRLLVAGVGDQRPWRALARRLGLDERVQWCGSTLDLVDFFHACDLILAPSRYDAYGLAVQEALCAEIPAVHSAGMGITERIPSELELLRVPVGASLDVWAKRVREVLEGRERLGRGLALLGRDLRSRDWERSSADFIELVNTTLEAGVES
jgi:glycosyltransferase involved in cell wall biosynthesis